MLRSLAYYARPFVASPTTRDASQPRLLRETLRSLAYYARRFAASLDQYRDVASSAGDRAEKRYK